MDAMILFAAIGLIFLTVGGAAYGVFVYMNPTRTATDRLREMTGTGTRLNIERDEAVDKITERLATLANPSSDEEKSLLRLRLMQAGYSQRHALEVFNAIRVGLAIGMPLIMSPVAATMSLTYMAGIVVVLATAGYYVPSILIGSMITTRQKKLLKPFPDALDMLVSSVEAGLGLDAAFRRVAEEMETAAPELAKEFQLVNHEISAGVTRIDALKHLAARTGLDEINALVNMLAQAERFGTSIARSLRVHSNMTRQKRMSKAEEEAAKVSPKLTIVMILFLLPCLMVVLIGPAVVNIKNAFFTE